MILGFALIGAVVAFIPGGSFLLIPMEVFLLFKIARKYDAFEMTKFIAISVPLIGISVFLKGLATFLQAVPVLGQFANSFVAFGFILAFGKAAEHHYSKHRSRTS